jgi:hypothetical protein
MFDASAVSTRRANSSLTLAASIAVSTMPPLKCSSFPVKVP